MLSGHESHGLDLELAHNLPELGHPPATRFGVVRGVSQVAGEDYEIRLFVEAVDRGDGFLQHALRVRIDLRAVEAPVSVGKLDEVEILVIRPAVSPDARGAIGPGRIQAQARSEDDSAQTREFHKIAPIDLAHNSLLIYSAFHMSHSCRVATPGNEDVRSSAFGRLARIIEPDRLKAELRTILYGNFAFSCRDRSISRNIPGSCADFAAGIKSRENQSYT
jgi:hypothetical protein